MRRWPRATATIMVTITATTEHARAPADALPFVVITKEGTADADDDYAPLSEEVTIAVADFALDSGTHYSAATTVTVTIIDDQVVEDDETLSLTLDTTPDTPAHATLGSAATVTITDDDVPEWTVNVDPNMNRGSGRDFDGDGQHRRRQLSASADARARVGWHGGGRDRFHGRRRWWDRAHLALPTHPIDGREHGHGDDHGGG